MAQTELRTIEAAAARDIADEYLANEVGNLLMAENPRLIQGAPPRWEMSILLGNARSGLLGQVGTIAVDAITGEVMFEEAEYARVKSNARELSRRTASSTGN